MGPSYEVWQELNFIVSNDNNNLFAVQPAITATGMLSYTPAGNAFGSATVTVQLHDNGGTAYGGEDTSAGQTFTITVTPVNDAPSFGKGENKTVLEDAVAQSVTGWATVISAGPANESTQTLNFIPTNNNNALFGVQPAVASNGTLTYTPAANANGSATVTLTLKDSGGTENGGVDTSAAQTFTIAVTAVNDRPTLNALAPLTINEDAGQQTVALSGIAAGGGESQALVVTATSSNTGLIPNPTVTYTSPNATGSIVFTPVGNAFGTATVTVTVDDGGAENRTFSQTFPVTVNAVNDAPSFVKDANPNQTVLEDAGAQSVIAWATSISAGPANEATQTLTFTATNNNNPLFSVQPAVASNGTLTYTPKANANGSATMTLTLKDSGGTMYGGIDTSAAQTFTITVTPVNDPPTLNVIAPLTIDVNAGRQTVALSGISAGGGETQSLTVAATSSNTALIPNPTVTYTTPDATGSLAFTPVMDSVGTATITVVVNDGQATNNSVSRQFVVTVQEPLQSVQFSLAASSGLETTQAMLTVILSGIADKPVTVNYATANGTAIAGSDYTATSGTLTFSPGVTLQAIAVSITNDTDQEPDETFSVTLSTPSNATLGTLRSHIRSIYDDGVPGVAGLKAIADAVDLEAWTFTTSVGANWWLQSAVSHDGSDAARSGFIADNQASAFETTGSFGAGTVSFWWKVSSEPGADLLRFMIDGKVKEVISGEVGWQQRSYSVTAGTHTLKWEYSKDGSDVGGIDAAWVDQVVVPSALVLWTRGDSGVANLWTATSSALPGGVLAMTGQTSLAGPAGAGGPWEASSIVHAAGSADYVLWSRGNTGQAILAKVDTAGETGITQVIAWAYLSAPAGDGPWRATSYAHQDEATGYVLWTRDDTGQAILAKVAPAGAVSGAIPVTSWAYLDSPVGVGGPWRATSYTYVDASTGYVLWSRGDTGQAILWKIAPGEVSGTIPVTSWAYLYSPAGAGAPWQATSYTHIDASEGYLLWTRGDTGQAILWQIVPGDVSGTISVTSWEYVSPAQGVGGPWRATSHVHGATPALPAPTSANPPEESAKAAESSSTVSSGGAR